MSPLITLLGGLALFLLAATAVSRALAVRGRIGPDLAANVADRIAAWWVIVGVLGGALLLGRWTTVLVFAALSALALREVLALSSGAGRPLLIAAFGMLLPAQYGLILWDWYGLFAILIPVYGAFLLPAIAALNGPAGFMARVSECFWALLLTVFAVSHLPGLLMLDIPGFEGRQADLIAWVIVTTQASDVAQFIWGKAMGRRKLAPVLSPSKTWEGLWGGALTATLIGAALFWLTPFGPVWAGIMAGLLCLLGAAGGLILSAVKRDRGVKDWGRLVRGHGGVMDRLDSLIFAAPVFFHLTRFGWSLT